MRHSLPQSHQFYVTAPQPCPYLAGKVERKLFTALQGDSAAALNDILSHQGFRRSQNVLYRPSCAGCSACLSARIVAGEFRPSRSHRRVLRRNRDVQRIATGTWATEAQYALFRRYLDARHAAGGMADMDMHEFAAMIEETPVQSRVVEYHRTERGRRRLVGVCLTDVLSDGLSMVYSFYEPDRPAESFGTYIILDHVALAREMKMPYVYLGYWVPGSPKMDYKARFQPLEIYAEGRWTLTRDANVARLSGRGVDRSAINEQVSAIQLPATK
jgi:leucyl-tRNA---protein transferase